MTTAGTANSQYDPKSSYVLPQGGTVEHGRLERQSRAILRMMHNQATHAPLKGPDKILDVGCGTGVITTQLALEHPEARVYGVDMTPVPDVHPKPSNAEYVLGSFQSLTGQDPRFGSNTFDFVFHRLLSAGMTDWPGYVAKAFALLKPGGWIEMQDVSYRWFNAKGDRVDQDWRWVRFGEAMSQKKGIDAVCGLRFKDWLRDAGFVDIHEEEYPWTFSEQSWEEHPECDDIGRYTMGELVPTMNQILARLAEGSDVEPEELAELQKEQADTLNMEKGGHMKFSVVWARKP